jgi:hypothetical protein
MECRGRVSDLTPAFERAAQRGRNMSADIQPLPPAAPWWRFRIVWLVAGLPLLAVAGSVVSAAIAMRHADPVIAVHRAAAEEANPMEPALQARNTASLKRP